MKIATFNVRGLTQKAKQQDLRKDMHDYDIDICCLQETKVTEESDQIENGYRLILLPSKCRHYGLGFIINRKWADRLISYTSISDRIAKAVFKLTKRTTITILNIYAPTQALTDKNQEQRDQFYEQLEKEVRLCNKTTSLFIAGDFNSKMGTRKNNEECIGKYARGRRNNNGQQLVEFCETHDLIAANTTFQHRASHQTTWVGSRLNSENKVVPIYNQIDYILVRKHQLHNLTNARAYAGSTLNSDHRLVIASYNNTHIFKNKSQVTKRNDKINISELATNPSARQLYQEEAERALKTQEEKSNAKDKWSATKKNIEEAARTTLGTVKVNKSKFNCPFIEAASQKQKKLRLQINNTKSEEKKAKLKKERNKLQHEIKTQISKLEAQRLDEKAEQIEALKDGAQMFQAVRELTKTKQTNVVVKSNQDTIAQPEEAVKEIAKYFSSLLNKNNDEQPAVDENNNIIMPTTTKVGPLENPITTAEVSQAIRKLKNGRATGPDGIPGELLKYGPPSLHKNIADILNQMMEKGEELDLGNGTLIVLQKPGKPKGPLSSLRPIVLLNTLRKTLSLIVLERIRPKVERFISPTQSGFRPNRSTSDAIWAHKWLIARTQKLDEIIRILGLDMSRAFDTIIREKLLAETKSIFEEDEWRIIEKLLAQTTLQAKINNILSDPFETTIGAPQGDSLSPVIFTVYLELALRELRASNKRPKEDINLPAEICYADDTDFISTSQEYLESINKTAQTILEKWNLKTNTEKTDLTILERKKEKQDEHWRKSKKLGTLLGDDEELKRRKQLAANAMNKLKALWRRPDKISEKRRIRLYNAYVKPILTYNMSTWALNQKEVAELEAFHRKQLRSVLGIFYPNIISNEDLYKTTKTERLGIEIIIARWKMLGHVLRMPNKTPAKQAMLWYFTDNKNDQTKGFRGRPRSSLPILLNQDLNQLQEISEKRSSTDLEELPRQLIRTEDLKKLESIAKRRKKWIKIIKSMHALLS